MKKVAVLFMLFILMVQSTSQLWIAASFFLNRDYIAKVLCINKAVPNSGCDGACQLKKQLKKDQQQQEKSGIDVKAKEVLAYFPAKGPQLPLMNKEWAEKTFSNTYFTSFLPEGFTHAIFHPPSIIV